MTRRQAEKPFGELLREFRAEAKLSQNALARAAGLDPTSLNRLENATSGTPRPSTIIRLARAFGWSGSHVNTKRLREAAGYESASGDPGRADMEQLRRLLARSVAEFNAWRENHDDTIVIDWTGIDLTPLALRTADFHGMILAGANLANADLVRANLREANLEGANLILTDLRGANLRGAVLNSADLSGADLRGANLHAAELVNATLRNADLRGADLRGSNLRDARMRKADLRRADLSNADLTGASLTEANLMKADFFDAILDQSDLKRAHFRLQELKHETDLERAMLATPSGTARYGSRPDQALPERGTDTDEL